MQHRNFLKCDRLSRTRSYSTRCIAISRASTSSTWAITIIRTITTTTTTTALRHRWQTRQAQRPTRPSPSQCWSSNNRLSTTSHRACSWPITIKRRTSRAATPTPPTTTTMPRREASRVERCTLSSSTISNITFNTSHSNNNIANIKPTARSYSARRSSSPSPPIRTIASHSSR